MLPHHSAIAKSVGCGALSLLGIVFFLAEAGSSPVLESPRWEHHQTLDAVGPHGEKGENEGISTVLL